jgi:hypothetical protein
MSRVGDITGLEAGRGVGWLILMESFEGKKSRKERVVSP